MNVLPSAVSVVKQWAYKITSALFFLYNQRDATYTMFFIIISTLHVSGRFFRPSSGTYKTVCAALGIVMRKNRPKNVES